MFVGIIGRLNFLGLNWIDVLYLFLDFIIFLEGISWIFL